MGTQDPGDLGMQEGSLSSNDIKTGSISHKVFLSEAGDRPLSTSSSTESICAGDSLNTEALAAHLHEDIFFLPSVRSVQDDSQDPGMSQPGGHIYLFLCCTGWCSLWAHFGGRGELIPIVVAEFFLRLQSICSPGPSLWVFGMHLCPKRNLKFWKMILPGFWRKSTAWLVLRGPGLSGSPGDPASSRRDLTWSSSMSVLPPLWSQITSYPARVYTLYESSLPLLVLGKTDSMTSTPKQKRLPPSCSPVKTCQMSRSP